LVTIQRVSKSYKLQATTTPCVVVFLFKNKISHWGKFQNIPLKMSAFFHFGTSSSRHAEAWSKLMAFSGALNSY